MADSDLEAHVDWSSDEGVAATITALSNARDALSKLLTMALHQSGSKELEEFWACVESLEAELKRLHEKSDYTQHRRASAYTEIDDEGLGPEGEG